MTLLDQDLTPYDPANPLPVDERLERELGDLDLTASLTIGRFHSLTFVLHKGARRIHYAAHEGYTWISLDHARALGGALRGELDYLGISFTTWEEDAAEVLAEATDPGARIGELIFSHKTADEATVMEARGLARLATKVEAHAVRWWSGEFDPGAIDAFCAELEALGNTRVTEIEVCDITLSEPDDRIDHEGLEALAARNRAAVSKN